MPIIHHVIVLVLIKIIDLIWHHLSIVEIHLYCWKVVNWIHEIVALLRHESLVSIRKIGSMNKVKIR